MRAALFVAVSFALVLIMPLRSHGQMLPRRDTVVIAPGTKIRAVLQGGRRHEGRLISIGRDTLLTERAGGTTAPLLTHDITKLEVSTGRHRPVLKYAAIGALGAGIAGGLAGAVTFKPCKTDEAFGCFLAPKTRGEAIRVGGGIGAVLGLVGGSLLGLIGRERWQDVRLDSRFARVSLVTPRYRSPGLGLAMSF